MKQYFFGREKELDLLRKKFFVSEPGLGYCAALNGPNDIGKTMLIRQAVKQFEETPHPNVYYFPTQIVADSSYWAFWSSLIEDFSDQITDEVLHASPKQNPKYVKQILDAYQFFTSMENQNQMGTRGYHNHAIRHLNRIFRAYTELGIHILITIDEFDNARTAFPSDGGDGSFFQRLYMLSPKSANEYSLSILLLSRRRISTIAHHMEDGSDIESAFPPVIVLRGFDNQEMECYFDSYQDLPCGQPDEIQQQKIYYLCGRHPGQLMKIRDLFERYYDGSKVLDPLQLYHDYGQEMTTLYERMNKLLRTEFVDRTNQRNCVGVFSQLYVGPAYDPNLPNYLEQLYKYGLLSKWDKRSKNIFQLAGLPYEDDSERRFDYEPMSPYYVEYFRSKVLPEELDGLNRLMSLAEQNVRDGILKVLKTHLPDTWENVLDNFTSDSKQNYRTNLDLLAYENDANARNIAYTNLDVLAYTDYSRIICTYWEQMRPFFRSFRTKDELKVEFEFLRDGRNCFAHNNAKILDEHSCSRLRELCSRLIQDYEMGENNVPVEEPATPAAKSGTVSPTLQQIQDLQNSTGTVIFCYQEKKKPKGNLRGIIKGYGFPAGISKAMLAGFGEGFEPKIGDEFETAVDRWDANAGMFNLMAP